MPPPPEADRCPQSKGGSQWVQHQDQCYAFRVTSPKSNVHNMEEAERICQGMGELWMGGGVGGLVFLWGPLRSSAHVAVVFVLPPDRGSRADYKIHGGEQLCVQVPAQRPSHHHPRVAGHECGQSW